MEQSDIEQVHRLTELLRSPRIREALEKTGRSLAEAGESFKALAVLMYDPARDAAAVAEAQAYRPQALREDAPLKNCPVATAGSVHSGHIWQTRIRPFESVRCPGVPASPADMASLSVRHCPDMAGRTEHLGHVWTPPGAGSSTCPGYPLTPIGEALSECPLWHTGQDHESHPYGRPGQVCPGT
jgi:hypothetical protein